MADLGLLYAGVFVGFLGVGVVIALMFLARFLVRHYAEDFDMEFRVLLLDAVKRGIRPDDMIKDLESSSLRRGTNSGRFLGSLSSRH
jgi:hypothetical protein